jgi:hypothetical protein
MQPKQHWNRPKQLRLILYLQADFYALQDSLNATVVAIEEQKSKMFGNYKVATEKLNEIAVTGRRTGCKNRGPERRN